MLSFVFCLPALVLGNLADTLGMSLLKGNGGPREGNGGPREGNRGPREGNRGLREGNRGLRAHMR